LSAWEEAALATTTVFPSIPPRMSLFRQDHHLIKQAKRASIPIHQTVFQTAECGRRASSHPFLKRGHKTASQANPDEVCPNIKDKSLI
jgi:hypothetical protein